MRHEPIRNVFPVPPSKRLTCLSALLILSLGARADAQATDPASWIPRSGPLGGKVTALLADGNDLYAGMGPSGVFRLPGGTGSWQPVRAGMEKRFVMRLAKSRDKLLAATNDGLFSLSAARKEWIRVPGTPRKPIYSLLAEDSLVWAGTDASVLRSTDGGGTWAEVEADPERSAYIWSLARLGRYLIAGCENGGGILRSPDLGLTWKRSDAGLPPSETPAVYGLAARSGKIFAATSSGLFASADSGAAWAKVTRGIPDPVQFTDVSASGDVLYAGSLDAGGFQSIDQGSVWTAIPGLDPKRTLTGLLAWDGGLWAGTGHDGVLVRKAGQSAWQESNAGLTALVPVSLACDGNLMAAASDRKVFLSRDRGATWNPVHQWDLEPELISVALWQGRLYIGSEDGLWEADLGIAAPVAHLLSGEWSHPLVRLGEDLILGGTGLRIWRPGEPEPAAFAGESFGALGTGADRLLGYDRYGTFGEYRLREKAWTQLPGPQLEGQSLIGIDSLNVIATEDLHTWILRKDGNAVLADSLDLPFPVGSFCRDGDRIYAGTAGSGIMEYMGRPAGIRGRNPAKPAKRGWTGHGSGPRFSKAGSKERVFDSNGRFRSP